MSLEQREPGVQTVLEGGFLTAAHDFRRHSGDDRQPWHITGYDSSGSQLIDRRWIYDYDAWAEAVALT